MTNLILCGGIGSRLWPLSRTLMPKQFYPLINNRSLFEETVLRNKTICDKLLLATNKAQYLLAQSQLKQYNIDTVGSLIEPCGRNTAPAIALACMGLDKEEIVLVTPSDQIISDISSYAKALQRAQILASENNLVTFGIKPTFPETGYGYIEGNGDDVVSFKEKPELSLAEEYFKSGNYYWNSGIFCFKAGVFLSELEKYSPEIYHNCRDVYNSSRGKLIEPTFDNMMKIESISIDYAVMERSEIVKVVPADMGWSDLGSFDALFSEVYDDSLKNAMMTNVDPVLIDSTNNLVKSKKQVALIDVNDLLVIDTDDALLISQKGSSQKVKEVVNKLTSESSPLVEAPLTVIRPWGCYTVLQDEPTFKVKRIEVTPGNKLSLQSHQKRQEHWTVVEGNAKVTVDDNIYDLKRNECVYIPSGSKHRLENTGKSDLILIETQIGSYFGEDDIERFDDDWGRI